MIGNVLLSDAEAAGKKASFVALIRYTMPTYRYRYRHARETDGAYAAQSCHDNVASSFAVVAAR